MSEFLKDIVEGLSSERKHIPSKYIYDDRGSAIFQEIMTLPEYYLTRNEFEILSTQGRKILDKLDFAEEFNVVELGAGDGQKTIELLKVLQEKKQVNYVPIDVSHSVLDDLEKRVLTKAKKVSIKSLAGDYFEVLSQQEFKHDTLYLFLGANIGNYTENESIALLKNIRENMNSNDKLMIGFDLKKNPLTIRNAYFDSQGVTKKFNMNLLIRMNAELGAEFMLDQFDFYCEYNPISGDLKSYLISLKDQSIYIDAADCIFNFKRNELILTELSKKYSLDDISHLAKKSGFKVEENFMDCMHNFTDSMWSLDEV